MCGWGARLLAHKAPVLWPEQQSAPRQNRPLRADRQSPCQALPPPTRDLLKEASQNQIHASGLSSEGGRRLHSTAQSKRGQAGEGLGPLNGTLQPGAQQVPQATKQPHCQAPGKPH